MSRRSSLNSVDGKFQKNGFSLKTLIALEFFYDALFLGGHQSLTRSPERFNVLLKLVELKKSYEARKESQRRQRAEGNDKLDMVPIDKGAGPFKCCLYRLHIALHLLEIRSFSERALITKVCFFR
jgi:hypothetical protein